MGLSCTFLAIPDALAEALQRGEVPAVEGEDALHIEKTWHALHYLISGSAEAGGDAARFILNGIQVAATSESDHIVCQRHSEVAAFAQIVGSLADESLRARFDPAQMNALKIYPGGWHSAALDLDYATQFFPELRAFFVRHAALGHGMIVTIV